jgi:hypothetical protein
MPAAEEANAVRRIRRITSKWISIPLKSSNQRNPNRDRPSTMRF